MNEVSEFVLKMIKQSNRITTLENWRIHWDSIFQHAKEKSSSLHVVEYDACIDGITYILYTEIDGTPLGIDVVT